MEDNHVEIEQMEEESADKHRHTPDPSASLAIDWLVLSANPIESVIGRRREAVIALHWYCSSNKDGR